MLLYFIFFVLSDKFSFATDIQKPTIAKRRLCDLNIIISLDAYNFANLNRESFESFHSISSLCISKIIVTDITQNPDFVVLQVHSYLVDITLSYDDILSPNTSVTGVNIGLVQLYKNSDMIFYAVCNECSCTELEVMIAVQAYKSVSQPRSCNKSKSEPEISPSLNMTFSDSIIKVDFNPTAFPYSLEEHVVYGQSSVVYKMYYQYFSEGDYTKETYFKKLKSLMTIDRIKENGILVPEKMSSSPTKRFFASYPGTGNSFVVVAHFGKRSTVYVPSATYACHYSPKNDELILPTTIFSQVICGFILIIGLFVCFMASYFQTCEAFLLQFSIHTVICLLITSLFIDLQYGVYFSVIYGLLMTCFTLYKFPIIFNSSYVILFMSSLCLGFLMTSAIFYVVLDFSNILVSDVNFWSIIIGMMIAYPVLMVCLCGKGNNISCGFLGSFVTMACIDYYCGSNIRYIFINTIRRAAVKEFDEALIIPPYQFKDVILSVFWVILAILGYTVTYILQS